MVSQVRLHKPKSLKTEELQKLRIIDLKTILLERGQTCNACVEKMDFVEKVQEVFRANRNGDREL